jgi:hypothetical protein
MLCQDEGGDSLFVDCIVKATSGDGTISEKSKFQSNKRKYDEMQLPAF